MGELLKMIPKSQGGRPSETKPTDGQSFTKDSELERIGIERHQAQRFETLASHPDIVERAKAAAHESHGAVILR